LSTGRLVLQKSTDNGVTWGSATDVIGDNYYNQNKPTAVMESNEHIWVFYELRYPNNYENNTVTAVTRSYDSGTTWDVPRALTSTTSYQTFPSAGILNYGDGFGDIYVHYMNSSVGHNNEVRLEYNVSDLGLPVNPIIMDDY
jgi:hypothetical protein